MSNVSAYVLKGLVDHNLIEILSDYTHSFGDPTITSLHRYGDTGVHGQIPCRGVDIRCRVLKVGEAIADWVNSRWEYDPQRPEKQCALAHNVGMGMHIHLQTHPHTRKR